MIRGTGCSECERERERENDRPVWWPIRTDEDEECQVGRFPDLERHLSFCFFL